MKYHLVDKFDDGSGAFHYTLDNEGKLLVNFDRQYKENIDNWSNNELITECIKKFEFLLTLVRTYNIKRFKTRGIHTCALCQVYFNSSAFRCIKCPIEMYTGMPQCAGTPYEEYANHHYYDNYDVEKFLVSEIEFLKSLPEYEENELIYNPDNYFIYQEEEL